jgi:hypothetical protein
MESKATLKGRKASFENILFNVEQIPLDSERTILQDYNFTGQFSSAIYCPGMNKILHMAGSNYNLVTNEELMLPIYDRLKQTFGESGITVRCTNEDDRRFSVRFILNESEIKVMEKDYSNLMIEVQNSYDGTLQHSISIYYWRQICSNGLMAWKKGNTYAQKHDKDYLINLKKILTKLNTLDEQMDSFRKLTDRRVTTKELEEIMLKARELKNHDAFPKKIIPEVPLRILQEAEQLDQEPNAWLVYNGFNYFLNHDERIGLGMDSKERIDNNILSLIQHQLQIN